jgi:O-antigen/teichoic acid export membrane protein
MFLATSTWNAAARGTFLLSSFLGTVLIARSLPPETYGLYALLAVLISYAVVVCDAGLSSGLLRFTTGQGSKRQTYLPMLLSSVGFQVAVGIGVVLLGRAAKPLLEQIYHVKLAHYLEFGVAIAMLTVLRLDLQNLRISAGSAGAIVSANLAFAVLWVGGLVVLSTAGGGLTEVLLLQTAAMALLAGWLLLKADYTRAPGLGSWRLSTAVPTGMLVYSFAFMTKGLINQVVLKQSELFFIGRYRTMHEVALYDVGYSFPFFALMSINQAIYPVAIASLTRVAEGGLPKLRSAIETFYKVLFIHVVPIGTIGLLFGDKLVELLYGPRLAPAGKLAQVFFGVQMLFFLTTGVVVGMYALGKPWVGFRIAILQALLNVVLDFLLIPRFGVTGAVFAVLGTLVLTTPLFFRAYAPALGAGLVPWSYLARCCGAASLMLVLLPLRQMVRGPLSLVAVLTGAVLIYLIGVRLFSLIGESENRLLRASGLRLANYAALVLGSRGSARG